MKIFLHRNGVQSGPFDIDQVRGMLAAGLADRRDLAWTDGLPDWRPLGELLAGQDAGPAAAGPPPPPAAPPLAPPPPLWAPQPLGPNGRPYSGFWRRFWAHFIDGFILSGASFALMLPFAVPLSLTRWGHDIEDWAAFIAANLLFTLAVMAVTWLYYAAQESSAAQATLGKRALGIVVTDLAGRRISFGRATGRYFAHVVTGFTLCIGYLMCIWTSRRQCLHDFLAETLVTQRPGA